jgi:hypothetical protein
MKSVWGVAGALALGAVVAYITWYFLVRLGTYTLVGLSAVLGAMLGGVAVVYLATRMKVDGAGFSQYAVGLLIGSVLYVGAYWAVNGHPATAHPNVAEPSRPLSVRYQGSVTLSHSPQGRDLDLDPPGPSADHGIHFYGTPALFSADGSANLAVLPPQGQPTYGSCRALLQTSSIPTVPQLSVGDQLCVLTQKRRIAALKVTAVAPNDGDVQFDVTVWE